MIVFQYFWYFFEGLNLQFTHFSCEFHQICSFTCRMGDENVQKCYRRELSLSEYGFLTTK